LAVNTDKTEFTKTKETVNVANTDLVLNGQTFAKVDISKWAQ
jgi:hypothetical protein